MRKKVLQDMDGWMDGWMDQSAGLRLREKRGREEVEEEAARCGVGALQVRVFIKAKSCSTREAYARRRPHTAQQGTHRSEMMRKKRA